MKTAERCGWSTSMAKKVERIFWLIAAIALGIYGLSIGERWLYQSYLNWQFAEMLQPPTPAILAGLSAATPASEAKALEGQPLARLDIPSIQLSAMVAEGVESRTLRRSVGHVPGTALPGASGNVGLSAHRDTFFRRLGELHPGDVISVTTMDGTFDYVVESTTIVNPDEYAVLNDGGRPMLTLITCYPFYYVGPAPKRFIVHAVLADD